MHARQSVLLPVAVAMLTLLTMLPVAQAQATPIQTPDGLQWAQPGAADLGPSVEAFQVLSTPDGGTRAVAWYANGHLFIAPVAGGSTVGRVTDIGPAFLQRDQPLRAAALDETGRAHIAWVAQGGVYYKTVDPSSGESSQAALLLAVDGTPSPGMAPSAAIAVSSIGGARVVYPGTLSLPAYEGLRFSSFSLSGLAVDRGLPFTGGSALAFSDAAVAPSPDGSVWVAMGTSSGPAVARVDGYGRVVLGPLTLAASPVYRAPSLVSDASGNAHMAWNGWESGGSGSIIYKVLHPDGTAASTVRHALAGEALSQVSLSSGSDGAVWLAWADGRDGGRSLYYVREGGIEVRFSTANGLSGIPAVTPERGGAGLHWLDGSTGFMKSTRLLTHSFSVEADPSSGFASAEPGATVAGAVLLHNTGDFDESIGITMTLPEGWSGRAIPDSLSVPSGGSTRIALTLTAPRAGTAGTVVHWTVNGHAASGVDSRAGFATVLAVRTGLHLSADAQVKRSGEAFSVTVTNTGNVDGTVALTGYASSGWSFSMTSGDIIDTSLRLPLPPGGSSVLGVRLSRAPGGNGLGSLLLTAAMEGASARAPLLLRAVAAGAFPVEMEATPPGGQVAPGGSLDFTLHIRNPWTEGGSVRVALEVAGGSPDWLASLDRDALALAGGAGEDVRLRVSAPSTAAAGEILSLRVKALSPEGYLLDDVTVTTVAGRQTVLALAPAGPRMLQLRPDEEGQFTLDLRNNGNARERVRMEPSSLPAGWGLSFEARGEAVRDAVLEAGSGMQVTAIASVPADAPEGVTRIGVRAAADSGGRAEAFLEVTVLHRTELRLSLSEPRVRGSPGTPALVQFYIENRGNGPETVHLSASGAPWATEFRNSTTGEGFDSLTIPSGGRSAAALLLMIPANVETTLSGFEILARAGEVVASARAFIELLLPDPLIQSVRYIEPQADGDSAQITVTVRNAGAAEARGLQVRFSSGSGIISEERLERLPAGEEKRVTFSWRPQAGRNLLVFTVDPMGLLPDRNRDNNVWYETRTVSGRAAEAAPVQAPAIGAVVVIAAVAAAVGTGTEWGKYGAYALLFVPLYSKLKKDDVLDHFVRGQVFGYIKANPGEHYNSIKKGLDLKNGVLVYHLTTLERAGFIVSKYDGRFRRFYPEGMSIPEEPEVRLNRIQEMILGLVREKPGLSQKEVAATIGLSGPTVNYHINVMLSARVIKLVRSGRETLCYISDEEEEDGMPPRGKSGFAG